MAWTLPRNVFRVYTQRLECHFPVKIWGPWKKLKIAKCCPQIFSKVQGDFLMNWSKITPFWFVAGVGVGSGQGDSVFSDLIVIFFVHLINVFHSHLSGVQSQAGFWVPVADSWSSSLGSNRAKQSQGPHKALVHRYSQFHGLSVYTAIFTVAIQSQVPCITFFSKICPKFKPATYSISVWSSTQNCCQNPMRRPLFWHLPYHNPPNFKEMKNESHRINNWITMQYASVNHPHMDVDDSTRTI